MATPKITVIGAGSSGSFIAHDLASRGLDVTIIEKGDIIGGTSGKFHGLLHSGARYAVNDVKTAKEGMMDNLVISKIAAHAIEDTGGIFAAVEGDDLDYAGKFVEGCKAASIPVEEIDPKRLVDEEPFLSKNIIKAFKVPDKVINSFSFITSLLLTAKSEGAKTLLNTEVVGFDLENGNVRGVKVKKNGSNTTDIVKSDLVINASGPWINKVVQGIGINSINMILSAGTMVVVGRRFTHSVINRLRIPSDGDIIVPFFGESIIGTTSFIIEDPDKFDIDVDDYDFLVDEGSKLIPTIKNEGVKRYYAGVRALLSSSTEKDSGRGATRDFRIFDHESDRVSGIITIGGGKLSTSRSMAKSVGDFVCRKFGVNERSKTDAIKLVWPDLDADKIEEISKKTSISSSVLKELVSETSSKTYSDVYSSAKDLVYSRMLFD